MVIAESRGRIAIPRLSIISAMIREPHVFILTFLPLSLPQILLENGIVRLFLTHRYVMLKNCVCTKFFTKKLCNCFKNKQEWANRLLKLLRPDGHYSFLIIHS